MARKEETPILKHKDALSLSTKVLSEEEGIVEAFVAGIGNKDSVGDIIQPGAFEESISKMKPKGVWSHDWNRPVSKTLEIYEVPAGDSRLPEKMKAAGIGGLYVKTQFNLDSQEGREAFSWVKFWEDESEWSIGYQTLDEEYDKKKKANLLKQVKLFEYSPVLFGANPLTSTVGLKVSVVSNGEDNDVEIKIEGIDDAEKEKAVTAALEAALKAELKEETSEDGAETKQEDTLVEETEEADSSEEKTEESGEGEASAEAEVDEKADEEEDEKSDESEVEESAVADAEEVDEKEEEDESDEKTDEEESDSEEEKTAMSAIVESFMTYAEKAEFSPSEAKALSEFIDERVDVKAVQGSIEQRLMSLEKAVRSEFEEAGSFVYLYATFDSNVVFYKYNYMEDEASFYEVSYSIGDEGVEFGDEKQVDVVEVVMAKMAVMDAAFKGYAEPVKSVLSPLVEVAAGVEGDADVKSAIEEALEAKAGRTLSKKTRSLIEDAADALSKVLESDKAEDSEEKIEEVDADEKSEETEIDEKTEEVEDLEEKSEETETDEKSEEDDTEEKSEEGPLTIPAEELEELKRLAAQYVVEESDED